MADGKQYSLKAIDTQMIEIILLQQNTLLSNFLSYIAVERLATNVTPNTRFDLSADRTSVTITEVEPEADAAEDSAILETPPAPSK